MKEVTTTDARHPNHSHFLYTDADGKEVVMAFAGTDPLSYGDWQSNILQGVGRPAPPQYMQAAREYSRLVRLGVKVTRFVGHSLGGGIASMMSLAHNIEATTFNAAGVRLW